MEVGCHVDLKEPGPLGRPRFIAKKKDKFTYRPSETLIYRCADKLSKESFHENLITLKVLNPFSNARLMLKVPICHSLALFVLGGGEELPKIVEYNQLRLMTSDFTSIFIDKYII